MKLLSLKVPDSLDHRLAHAASCRKSTKSEVVREALNAFLAETGDEQAGSALTLAKDLAGCVTGPSDLSVNPVYLKQFGRPLTQSSLPRSRFTPCNVYEPALRRDTSGVLASFRGSTRVVLKAEALKCLLRSLRPCWTACLCILRVIYGLTPLVRRPRDLSADRAFPQPARSSN